MKGEGTKHHEQLLTCCFAPSVRGHFDLRGKSELAQFQFTET